MTEEIKQNNMCCLTKGIMGIGKAVPQDSMHTDQGTSSLNPYRYKIRLVFKNPILGMPPSLQNWVGHYL